MAINSVDFRVVVFTAQANLGVIENFVIQRREDTLVNTTNRPIDVVEQPIVYFGSWWLWWDEGKPGRISGVD